MADVSPEKRLLDIIEGKETAGRPSALQQGRKQLAPSAIRARFAFLKNKFKFTPPSGKTKLSLRQVNVVMQVIVFILLMALLLDIRFEIVDFQHKKKFNFSGLDNEAKAETAPVTSLLQPEDTYLDKVRARNIFSLAKKELPANEPFKEEQPQPQESKLQKMVQDLRLVGISWAKDPDAIVENTATKKTYFVKTGSMIDEIKVEAIYKDKIILHYGAEEVELR